MRTVSLCATLASLLILASCQRAPEAAKPSPLKLETRHFEKLLPGCGDKQKREEPCVTFRVSYPEVTTAATPEALTRINAAIQARLQPADAPRGFDAEATTVIDDFNRFQKEFPDSGLSYFVRRTAEVTFSNAHLLTIEIDEDEFKGGAHPNARRDYLNLDPTTGNDITLKSLLANGDIAALTQLVEKRFRAERQIEDGKKYSDAGFTFADDKFVLGPLWGLTATGLVIHYNSYDIAPHAAGPTTIQIPWSDLRTLVRKDAGILPAK